MRKLIYIFLCSLMMISISFAKETTLEKLTVVLDWFPNPDHAPLIIAKQQGYFKEQGLSVTLIGPSNPNDPPKWVAAKKADIGITYQPEFMEQVDQGLPLIRIGTLIDKPLNCLVALESSHIKSARDLKGKKIGVTSSGLTDLMLEIMLEKHGLTKKDVEIVDVHYNLTQSLLSHQVDAVTGLMRNFEIPQIESKNHKIVAFFPEENGIPTYNELIFIANIDHVQDPRYPRFLAAIKKAVEYLDANPKKAWLQFIKQYPEANNAVNRHAWFATMPYFAEEPENFDREEWEQFAKFMQQNKLIKTVKPITRYAVALPGNFHHLASSK